MFVNKKGKNERLAVARDSLLSVLEARGEQQVQEFLKKERERYVGVQRKLDTRIDYMMRKLRDWHNHNDKRPDQRSCEIAERQIKTIYDGVHCEEGFHLKSFPALDVIVVTNEQRDGTTTSMSVLYELLVWIEVPNVGRHRLVMRGSR